MEEQNTGWADQKHNYQALATNRKKTKQGDVLALCIKHSSLPSGYTLHCNKQCNFSSGKQ